MTRRRRQAGSSPRKRRPRAPVGNAIERHPAQPAFRAAEALRRAGHRDEAESALRSIVARHPDHAPSLNRLGRIYLARGDASGARAYADAAHRCEPRSPIYLSNLAVVLISLGHRAEAEGGLEQALSHRPGYLPAILNLAHLRRLDGRLGAAVELLEGAEKVEGPAGARMLVNLASARIEQGRVSEAAAGLARWRAMGTPDPAGHGVFLLAHNYLEGAAEATLLSEHRDWAARHYPAVPPTERSDPVSDPERRLRIGYLSPDLREHSVARFLLPVLRAHRRSEVEVHCYASVPRPDAMTERLRTHTDHWHDVSVLPDDGAARLIAGDRIDVLVDLAGHTAGNRLGILAHRPAPVQMSYLGYPNTTGLDAVGYRLTDAVSDPPGAADRHYVERLARLTPCFLCYDASEVLPPTGPPPVLHTGAPTFGSFNTLAKLSTRTLSAWAMILGGVVDARLHLKCAALGDEATRRLVMGRLADAGIAEERVSLLPWVDGREGHLAAYGAIDVALDPLAYNGTTTTCEALSMGVPVVTLAGATHRARVGASLLGAIDCPELVAADEAQYVDIACRLACDPQRLSRLRQVLPERMRTSALTDAGRFVRALEGQYRAAWERYCAGLVIPRP